MCIEEITYWSENSPGIKYHDEGYNNATATATVALTWFGDVVIKQDQFECYWSILYKILQVIITTNGTGCFKEIKSLKENCIKIEHTVVILGQWLYWSWVVPIELSIIFINWKVEGLK